MKTLLAATAATALFTAPALAATAITTTDLNLRSGPSSQTTIEDVIPAQAEVMLDGCVESGQWCKVTYDGTTGFAFASYLATVEGEEAMPIAVETTRTVEPAEYNGATALAGGAMGAAVATGLAAGPAGIAGAIALGSLGGAFVGAEVEEQTVAYVVDNPTETIFVEGEIATGAVIPEGVELTAIEGTDLSYAYLNGQPVIVDGDRAIIRIVR